MYLQLFIINRSGGLIYNQDLSALSPRLTVNDFLRLGSTFHSLHAISTQLVPGAGGGGSGGSGGIEQMEFDTFKLHCFQSLTGYKFVLTAEPNTVDMDGVLQRIYEAFADFALKDPFYELEMPIRSKRFKERVTELIDSAVQQQNKGRRYR